MSKGPNWERQVPVFVSNWFSKGAADDWFWRTSGSGARATVRRRKGKQTINAAGDIGPCCGEAEPLTRVFCIELKRGAMEHPAAFFDRKISANPRDIENGVKKTLDACLIKGGPRFWMLLARRDRAQTMVYVEEEAAQEFDFDRKFKSLPMMAGRQFMNWGKGEPQMFIEWRAVFWEDFIERVEPQEIREYDKWLQKEYQDHGDERSG